jgi:peptidoglycan-binding protein ArfA
MVGPEVDVGDAPAPADAPGDPKFQRQALIRPWLIGVAVVPFLLAMIGYGAYERPMGVNGPTGALPTLTSPVNGPSNTSSAPSLSLSLFSISRSGNSITLVGDFPDDAAKARLMKSLKGLMTPGVNVVDQIRIDPLVHALDFANAEPVFTAGVPIPDFNFKVERDTVILSGTAASPDQKDAVGRAAASAWPNVNVTNKIAARGQITLSAPPGSAPAPTPGPASCDNLPAAINALTGGPLAFGIDGVSLTPADKQILIRVADKLKACPNGRVTINGYTDNSGAETMNIPLSSQRASLVAEYLIANGVARDHVTAKGLGSANPIASNDTAEGRAKNRRVEVVVS